MKTGIIIALIGLAAYKLAEIAGNHLTSATIAPLVAAIFAMVAAFVSMTISKGSAK